MPSRHKYMFPVDGAGMSQLFKNPITQDISSQVDVEGIKAQCMITVTDKKKYPFKKMARLAEYIKTDIKDDITLSDGNEEEPDDTL